MAPLITLIFAFTLARLIFHGRRDRALPGRVALSAMLFVTGMAHFTASEALVAMVPPVIPSPLLVVHTTGVAEFAFALLLLVRPSSAVGWGLAAFFLALLPANIYSALQEVGMGGHGPAYLMFRVPLQIVFMGWAVFSTGGLGRLCSRARRAPERAYSDA